MPEFFEQLSPVWQALLAGTFTWSITALGATAVFFKNQYSERSSDVMMGFAAGVMIAASFWSLLAPSIEILEYRGAAAWLGVAIGFHGNTDLATMSTIVGFTVMMCLDVGLG